MRPSLNNPASIIDPLGEFDEIQVLHQGKHVLSSGLQCLPGFGHGELPTTRLFPH